MISMLFGEQVFKFQQILVSFSKPIKGVFKPTWHKMQWEEEVLALCYIMQSDISCVSKCIVESEP